MKILQIIPQLGQGGAERFVIDLCNEMSKVHDVTLIVFYDGGDQSFFKEELSERVHFVVVPKRPGADMRLSFQIVKFIKRMKPDVVHTHLRAIVYTLLSGMMFHKVKFFHTVHSEAEKEAGGKIGKFSRKVAFKTRRFIPITISEETMHSFESLYNVRPELIYNGRPGYHSSEKSQSVENELHNLRTDATSKLIVNVARIENAKNQVALAKAVEHLNQRGVAIDLCIIGNPMNQTVYEELKRMEAKHVHLLGVRMNPRDYMKAADAFCLSSIYEGMPITLIECFSVGAIPLCTPVGGIRNMIQDGENGMLAKGVTQQDIEDLLKRFYMTDTIALERMKEKSLSSFRHYDMQTCANRYIRLFEQSR